MATSSIAFSSHTTTQPQTVVPTSSAKSFSSRCIEDLSPDKISTMDRQSTLFLVLAGVAVVAFTALAVAGFVATGVLAPAYIPLAGLGALLCAMPAAEGVKNLLKWSENSGKEANKYRAIQHHYQELSNRTSLDTQVDLMNRGIVWFQIPGIQIAHPENLASLDPILAQAKYLDDKIQEHLRMKDTLTADARDLANADFAKNRQKIYDLRNSALSEEDKALEAKIQAGFVNAVLRKSDYNGTLEDIASLSHISYHERILGNELRDPSGVNEFLTFKDRNLAPITFDDVKTMTVAQLGQRLVAAMA